MKVCVLGVVALLGVGSVSAKAVTPQATTTTKSTDKALDERIEKRINTDATLKKYHVDAMVTDGVATLSGVVPTEADRRKAEQLATVSGISRVDNQDIRCYSLIWRGSASLRWQVSGVPLFHRDGF